MKNQNKFYIFCISLITILLSLQTYAADGPSPYMGQKPPGLVPKIFAPGLISIPNRFERNICFTADGREYYFNTRNSSWTNYQIFETHYENGQWTTPVRASFSDTTSLCPSLSNNDQTLHFTGGSQDIYRVTRTAGGWSSRVRLGEPISSSNAEYSCHISSLGNLWMCSHRSGGVGGCDIWYIPLEDGQLGQPLNLRTLNTGSNDCAPVPGFNEEYIIWMANRPGGFGNNDLYISFPDDQGGWTAPKNLGPPINTSIIESAAFISPDRKYLFFTRDSGITSDIYWVSVKAFLPDPDGPVFNMMTGQRFSSIQAAINYASSGQTILLAPGKYEENIIMPPKELTIRSANAQDSAIVSLTSCSGDSESPVITLSPASKIKLQGLTICDGAAGISCSGAQLQLSHCVIKANHGCGIEISDESTLEMSNCIIAGNTEAGISSIPRTGGRGGAVYSDVEITNCTIVQNEQCAIDGGGMVVANSIIYFNGQSADGAQIDGENIDVTFSDVQGGFEGDGNINADPEFVELGVWVTADPDYYTLGDSHLKSAAGRCNAITSTWVLDSTTSPCIDAGNADDSVGSEPSGNGGVINMGAYGGTPEASRTAVPE
ncbi:MAG: right-handed parallel beta-helix repeat-containing protein [Phycisphaerales bacterium]